MFYKHQRFEKSLGFLFYSYINGNPIVNELFNSLRNYVELDIKDIYSMLIATLSRHGYGVNAGLTENELRRFHEKFLKPLETLSEGAIRINHQKGKVELHWDIISKRLERQEVLPSDFRDMVIRHSHHTSGAISMINT
ncbi:hypothetical protein [Vulcanisaeta sp. JCM 16159]|uniref:hypothetical protein n=1 Tax=Vulcanisaeta sp. JCM 16159 TaxID=1295371 RepID=UPI000A97F89C|nr:hypothetical protein [Vulcanisaeta sp. JCM 16159]